MNLQENENGQTVLLKDRARLEVDGVSDVVSFDEAAVILRTALGGMTVEGEGLHITRLDLEKGLLALEGRIGGIFYTGDASTGKKGGFFSRLMK
ncbi:MAG: sporulation protein YabP [Clostridia bacterium]|nr:sporulation protein YabP [Clostridia bacterium]